MSTILIETDSKVMLDQKLQSIIKNSSNKVIYTYKDYPMEDIIGEAAYVSMFEEMKYLVVKNANFFVKDKLNDSESKMLTNYLEHQNPYTTLIFTTYEPIDKRKTLTKKVIENAKFYSLQAPKGYDLFNETMKLIKNNSYTTDDKNVKYIIEACLNNWDLINSEIAKLSLYYKAHSTLDFKSLQYIISNNAKDNNWKFIQAVIDKDIKKSFSLLDDLLLLKVEPLQLINLLAREYRLMLMYQLLAKKRFSSNEMLSILKLSEWQLDKVLKNSTHYHIDDLASSLIQLSTIDYKIKSGQLDKVQALQQFMLEQFEY